MSSPEKSQPDQSSTHTPTDVFDPAASEGGIRNAREDDERFRQFAENSADVFWIMDAKTRRVEYLNPAYEKMFGQPRAAVLRDRMKRLELVPKEDRAEASRGLERALAGQTFVRNYRIVRPADGATRWIRDTGFPIRDEKGEIVRIAGVAQDVTEDKERTEALRESEEKLRLLIEGTPDYAMMMLDPSNHIIYWNEGAERVFGWSADEVLGKSGELIFTPEDRARKAEEKEIAIARREGVAPDRRWHLRKDGSRIWIDGVMHRLDDGDGGLRGYAKIARDATDERHAQELLEQRVRDRTRELQAMNHTLQQEMAHRQKLERQVLEVTERERLRLSQDLHDTLCQELTAAALMLKSSAKKFGGFDPAVGKALIEGAEMVNRNAGLARDLARGMHPLELGTGGLPLALRELAARTNERVPCLCEGPRSLRLPNEMLAVNLYRIAQEAVTNAIRHARPSQISISLERLRNAIALSVSNDGARLRATKTKRGLGKDMMKYRARMIGGDLTIESKRGEKGTTVTCRVPLRESRRTAK